MLKRSSVRKLGRSKNARTALLRSISRNLFENGVVETSDVRAKVVRAYVDRLLRSSGNLMLDQRKIASTLGVGRELVYRIARLCASIPNGRSSTRIVKIGARVGDNSPRVKLELLTKLAPPKAKVKPKEEAKSAKKTEGKKKVTPKASSRT
ncbi:MAG: hypothetical protein A2782_00705 [Candidatus Blackburnbacteria bacterium RIFCSPHIGHO2_01_FULL_43_15b]|uniref:50S ribosomal protein L17 n=1 Tax=Candidatus Blackburnbacteria bacterium RIFCSPHIGHO2_01_FULL_43_15b TaxID=1797513 RepID=A0A1G1UZ19_9BACT|nr:MAG: hypothetical protein A2782_00705 [Candidatus Blackburnbacteria bacterium RIFCSPHIGHO2_01_FULL_43_15b]